MLSVFSMPPWFKKIYHGGMENMEIYETKKEVLEVDME